ncbi:UNVERIFIED_CONTAM: hypothetical protein Sradi_3467800 [Sesamum radiatum]|uniref:Uncharacterized protein n=1 Tax=Sesamum radiatum TaxID=300843 RepID=A0AAW2QDW0_SESRA
MSDQRTRGTFRKFIERRFQPWATSPITRRYKFRRPAAAAGRRRLRDGAIGELSSDGGGEAV